MVFESTAPLFDRDLLVLRPFDGGWHEVLDYGIEIEGGTFTIRDTHDKDPEALPSHLPDGALAWLVPKGRRARKPTTTITLSVGDEVLYPTVESDPLSGVICRLDGVNQFAIIAL